MRTTILLDDRLGERLRARARQEGKSFSTFLAEAGLKALEAEAQGRAKPFRLVTFRGEGVHKGVNLDRTTELLTAEDVATFGDRPR